jgi:hypothetical protein
MVANVWQFGVSRDQSLTVRLELTRMEAEKAVSMRREAERAAEELHRTAVVQQDRMEKLLAQLQAATKSHRPRKASHPVAL